MAKKKFDNLFGPYVDSDFSLEAFLKTSVYTI